MSDDRDAPPDDEGLIVQVEISLAALNVARAVLEATGEVVTDRRAVEACIMAAKDQLILGALNYLKPPPPDVH